VNWDFRAPTRAGDTIHAAFDVVEMRPVKNPDHGLVEFAITLLNQRESIVQSGAARLLLLRSRPPSVAWGLIATPAAATKRAHEG
jgi:acyl dehydratase